MIDIFIIHKAFAFVPESALIVIVLVLPVEAEVIFKKRPSTAMVAPAIVIPLAAAEVHVVVMVLWL